MRRTRQARVNVMPCLRDLTVPHRMDMLVEPASRLVNGLVIRAARARLRHLVASGQLVVGEHTYGLPTVEISHPDDRVEIGRYCSIASDVILVPGGRHPLDVVSSFPFKARWGLESVDSFVQREGPIVIGHDVWLATRCMILSGVTVGTGAVVAAGAVVTKDVRAYEIVGGIPAKHIGWRFDSETIQGLLDSEWWELPEEVVLGLIDQLTTGSPSRFLDERRAQRGGGVSENVN